MFWSSSLADCLFAFSLPPKLLFTSAGLADAEYLCPRPWQTAYLRVLCPKIVFTGAGLPEAEYLSPRPWQTAYLRFFLPPPKKLFLQVLGLRKLSICVFILGRLPICASSAQQMCLQLLGLPKLILCVVVLGRLPICVFSAPKFVFRNAGLA